LGNSGPLKRQNEQRTQYFKDYEKSKRSRQFLKEWKQNRPWLVKWAYVYLCYCTSTFIYYFTNSNELHSRMILKVIPLKDVDIRKVHKYLHFRQIDLIIGQYLEKSVLSP
jgi:hypothetical protein